MTPTLSERYAMLRALWRPPTGGDDPCYATAGLWDPEERVFPNQHYGLSHLVLTAQILGQLSGDDRYIRHRDEMIALLERQYAGGFAGFDVNSVHWDFNNLALLLTAHVGRDGSLAARLCGDRFRCLARENATWAANWVAMRKVGDTLRGTLGLRRNPPRRLFDAWKLRRVFRADGGIDEYAGKSRPIQYHAYVLALLICNGILRGRFTAAERTRIRGGVDYLIQHVDSAGNANYRGRGQYQLFFEGPVRYVLAVMRAWCSDPEDAALYDDRLHRLDSVPWPTRGDGLLALVRTDPDGERTGAYYDYHYLVVYNAFDLAWRALAELHVRHVSGTANPFGSPTWQRDRHFAESGLFIAHRGEWTIAIAAGESVYLADTGITPCHLGGRLGTLFSAPGGPHPGRYGRRFGNERLLENVFAPLIVAADGSSLPHFAAGRLACQGSRLQLSIAKGERRIERLIDIGANTLACRDRVQAPGAVRLCHVFHWALPETLRLHRSSDGVYTIAGADDRRLARLVFTDGTTDALQFGEPFRGPGGRVRPVFIDARSADDTIAFTLELSA